MARCGRLSKEAKNAPIDPINQQAADEWMAEIGKSYDEIKKGCRANCLKRGLKFNEDIFQQTIILCYESIQRNNIKDKTNQGARNYLFRSLNTNIIHDKVIPYNSRRVDDEEVLTCERIDDNGAREKIENEVYNDFAAMYLLSVAEENVDSLSFYTFRLKYLIEKMSYSKLIKLTKLKNAKARVKSVVEYLKENVTEEEIRNAYDIWQENLENNENKSIISTEGY